MSDPLDQVLRLVAEGRLTPEEAAPVIEALETAGAAVETANAAFAGRTGGAAADEPANDPGDDSTGSGAGRRPRVVLLEVTEAGRKVVNLRVPISLGRMALDRIPGLSIDNVTRIRQALDEGMTGPILVVDEDDDGDGVRIVLE